MLKHLRHPNIVEYIGMEHKGDFTNVFLEYVYGDAFIRDVAPCANVIHAAFTVTASHFRYVPGGSIHSLLLKFGAFNEVRVPTDANIRRLHKLKQCPSAC